MIVLATRYFEVSVIRVKAVRNVAYHCRRYRAGLNGTTHNANNGANLEDSDSTDFGRDGASHQGAEEATGKEQAIGTRDDRICPTVARGCRVRVEMETGIESRLSQCGNDY